MLSALCHILHLAAFLPHGLHISAPAASTAATHPFVATGVRRAPQLAMHASDDDHWTNDDDDALSNFINRQSSVAKLGPPDEVMVTLDAAYVLIFNPGSSDEGVYTLQGRATKASAYVLAFERTEDGHRFADLLHAEGFDRASLVPWNKSQFSSFCSAGAFEISLVPTGTLIVPPSKNEYDHNAFDKLVNKDGDPYAKERAELEHLFRDL